MNRKNLDPYIRISADSLGELRRVDVHRVISSVCFDNIDGVTRGDLATWIATHRPDLTDEVMDVMQDEFPDESWKPATMDAAK
ncbi:hypothetical protein HDG34_003189 [Paraburkholderia sp. HC6.4b]|uniref:hypothetical protein n=1 Tax=unclassified Paraburkholderia TaxID=2615204 RepID=UPI00160BF98D|nr:MULTISPECIES: hypothetical protein [unclassified Paraburkholderia]MBB5409248.1 hypothetical protein [Paraburkholderia sp. HC6.4b]MBB5450976.1 hypothetical protein [Paraburkholderia sp. Kb1A]